MFLSGYRLYCLQQTKDLILLFLKYSKYLSLCLCVCVTAVKYNINRNNTHSAFSPLILGLKLKYTIKIVNTSPLFKFMPYI